MDFLYIVMLISLDSRAKKQIVDIQGLEVIFMIRKEEVGTDNVKQQITMSIPSYLLKS